MLKKNGMLVCKVVIKKLPFELDYLAKKGTRAEDYPFGIRVQVPYRSGMVIGMVVGLSDHLSVPLHKAKHIVTLLDPGISMELQRSFFISFCRYYTSSIAELLQMCIPKLMWAQQEAVYSKRYVASVDKVVTRSYLTVGQWRLYDWLREKELPVSCGEMLEAGFRQKTIDQCIGKDMLTIGKDCTQKAPPPPDLTQAQQSIYDQVINRNVPENHYIYGITGSGKTYLYIALARYWIDRGGQVLLLVPEIGLTPQLTKKVRKFFAPGRVRCLHSGLSDVQRYQTWQECASETVQLLIGTRSALFAPLPSLSAVIIDEEHDLSYQQMSQIRYSARGVAFMRAKSQGVNLILGSATPSLSALKLVEDGLLQMHQLTERFQGYALPQVELVPIQSGCTRVGFAKQSLDVVGSTLSAGKRVLVFINRRGYAPCLWCPNCDQNIECLGCEMPMTYHQADKIMECHRCQVKRPVDYRCGQCGLGSCIPLGQGTEKVSLFLASEFSGYDVIKMDKDTCGTWNQLQSVLQAVHKPGPKVIVATQMLVKGHHIEGLDAVIVLGADHSLFSKDYKAKEHLLSQMHQVLGRAGRDGGRGHVLIQTEHPTNSIWDSVINHMYLTGAGSLLKERRQYGLPPFSAQVVLCLSAKHQKHLIEEAALLAKQLREDFPNIDVIGPMPSLQPKLKGSYRYTVLLQAQSKRDLQAVVNKTSQLQKQLMRSCSLIMDRDPVEF